MTEPWKFYQEEAAEFFRSIGLSASTDVTLQGIRTKHDVDVFVTIDVAGFEVKWIVECKHWKSAVTKLHVLALREIVSDLGVDRGIILCESGFQSGAIEAANLTNVQVTSLSDLGASSKGAIYAARLRDLFDRTETCREKYWDIPKAIRIKKGLRFDSGFDHLYSGARVVDISAAVLSRALRGNYPIRADDLFLLSDPAFPKAFDSPEDVFSALEPLIRELEEKLAAV